MGHIGERLHHHVEPDVYISIYGADQAGIVAETTGALTKGIACFEEKFISKTLVGRLGLA